MQRQKSDHVTNSPGLDIILGCMYAGKSTELLRRLSTVTEVGLQALYVNHALDKRNPKDIFSTHNPTTRETLSEGKIRMISTDNLADIEPSDIHSADIIGVDEGQFFADLGPLIVWIEKYHKRVILASLDGDYKREKFGHVLGLIPKCDSVVKLTSFCNRCSLSRTLTPALFTHYIQGNTSVEKVTIEVGAHDKYEALCRACYFDAQF